MTRSPSVGFWVRVTRFRTVGFCHFMTRFEALGFSRKLTRLTLLGFSEALTRFDHVGFWTSVTRSVYLGFLWAFGPFLIPLSPSRDYTQVCPRNRERSEEILPASSIPGADRQGTA